MQLKFDSFSGVKRVCLLVILFAALVSPPVSARSEEPVSGGFTFRRIAAPSSGGSGNLITVQIDPVEQAAAWNTEGSNGGDDGTHTDPVTEEDTPVVSAIPRTPQAWGWFWETVKPGLADSGPGRLETAINLLANPPPGKYVPQPRLQDLQTVATRHGLDILSATIGTDVSPALVLAVIGIESSGRVNAVSSAGATGLMQLMPATAERFGVTDRNDAVQNIRGGVAYLDWLMKEFDGDPVLVLAGYNAGEGAVRNNAGVPPYNETRAYVPKVLAAWQVARGLCITPPQLITDGCVFNVDRVGPNG